MFKQSDSPLNVCYYIFVDNMARTDVFITQLDFGSSTQGYVWVFRGTWISRISTSEREADLQVYFRKQTWALAFLMGNRVQRELYLSWELLCQMSVQRGLSHTYSISLLRWKKKKNKSPHPLFPFWETEIPNFLWNQEGQESRGFKPHVITYHHL